MEVANSFGNSLFFKLPTYKLTSLKKHSHLLKTYALIASHSKQSMRKSI